MKHILLFILLAPLLTVAQNSTVDSLNRALKEAKHDTLRCAILNHLIDSEPSEEKINRLLLYYYNRYIFPLIIHAYSNDTCLLIPCKSKY